MGAQENKALIVRLYDEVYAKWNFRVLDELIGPAFIGHGAPPGTPPGPSGVKQFYEGLRAAFPDLRYHIEDLVAEDDKVVVRWTWRGTHQGAYYGIPPTGKQATAAGIAIYRIEDGKCVERWVGFNPLGVLRQLGANVPDVAPSRA